MFVANEENVKTQETTENKTPSAGAHSVMDSSVFEFSEFSNSSSIPLSEEPKMPVPPMEENCLTNIIKDTPPITNLRVLDSDDDLTVDKVNDIWMDINLDNSLSNSSNKALSAEDCQLHVNKLNKRRSSLRHFRKNKYGGVCSIMDRSSSLDSSRDTTLEPFTDTTSDIVKQIINLEKAKEMPNLDDCEVMSPCDLSEEAEISETLEETTVAEAESSKTLEETIENESDKSTVIDETPVSTTNIDDSKVTSEQKCDNLNDDKEPVNCDTRVVDTVSNKIVVDETVEDFSINEKEVESISTIEKVMVDEDNLTSITFTSKCPSKDNKIRKSLDSSLKNILFERPRKRARSEELDYQGSYQNQEDLLNEFKNIKRKRNLEQQDNNELFQTNVIEPENLESDMNNTKNNNLETSTVHVDNANIHARRKSSDFDHNRTNDNDPNLNLNSSISDSTVVNNVNDPKTENNVNNEKNSDQCSSLNDNMSKNGSLPLLPDTKPVYSSKRRFSIFDPDEISTEKSEEASAKNCIDSNINIQLPNVNLQIKDKTETNSTSVYNNVSKESITIEINVSRVESQRTHDNPVVSTSNQHLNISLPPSDPISCKVDCITSVSVTEEEKEARIVESPPLSVKEVVEEKSLSIEKDKEVEPSVEEVTDEGSIISFENKNALISDNNSLVLENKNKNETESSDVSAINLDKKEEEKKEEKNNATEKKEIVEETPISKDQENCQDKGYKDTIVSTPGCSKDFDFDNFDVEPCNDKIGKFHNSMNSTPDEKDKYYHSRRHSKTVGFLNPLFHLEELGNLDAVPVYTTKDGLQYSENRNYTYRALIIEARKREGHRLFRDYFDDKGSWSKRKKYGRSKYKSSYYKRRYDGETGTFSESSSYESYTANEHDEIEELKDDDCDNKFDNSDYKLPSLSTRLKIKDSSLEKNEYFTNNLLFNRYSPKTPRIISPAVIKMEEIEMSLSKLDSLDDSKKFSSEKDVKCIKKNIVDLEDLEENILKKLQDQERNCTPGLTEFESQIKLTNLNKESESDVNEKTSDLNEFKSISSTSERSKREINEKTFHLNEFESLTNANDQLEPEISDKATHLNKFEPLTSQSDKLEPANNEKIPHPNEFESLTNTTEQLEPIINAKKCEKTNTVSDIQQTVEVVEQVLNAFESDMFENNTKKNELYDEIEELRNIPMPDTVNKSKHDEELKVSHKTLDFKETKSNITFKNNTESKKESCFTNESSELKENIRTSNESVELEKLSKDFNLSQNEDKKFESVEKGWDVTKKTDKNEEIFFKSAVSDKSDTIQGKKRLNENKKIVTEVSDESNESDLPSESKIQDFKELENLEKTIISRKTNSREKEVSKKKTKSKKESTQKLEFESDFRYSKDATESRDSVVSPSKKDKMEQETNSENITAKSSTPPSLMCSINKKIFSFELCNKFIAQEKLHADQTDNTSKTVPKLVIRKSDTNPKFFSKSKSVDENNSDEFKKDSPTHPKIPKMIIRNARSRPATPSIEEISETGSPKSDSEVKPVKVKIKLDDSNEKLQNSTDSAEKIPKMKINLEERLPRVIIENISLSSFENQKMVPKMKITNVKSSLPKIIEKQLRTELDIEKSDTNSSFSESENPRVKDKSKSRPKKDSPGHSSSSESSVKRSSSGSSSQSKKNKRSPKEEVILDPILEETQFTMDSDCKHKNSNSNSSASTTKIPKVIIKRASPSAEFKCELSKEAIVNAQPQVVLTRMRTLDSMAKNLKSENLEDKVQAPVEEIHTEKKIESNELQWERYVYKKKFFFTINLFIIFCMSCTKFFFQLREVPLQY